MRVNAARENVRVRDSAPVSSFAGRIIVATMIASVPLSWFLWLILIVLRNPTIGLRNFLDSDKTRKRCLDCTVSHHPDDNDDEVECPDGVFALHDILSDSGSNDDEATHMASKEAMGTSNSGQGETWGPSNGTYYYPNAAQLDSENENQGDLAAIDLQFVTVRALLIYHFRALTMLRRVEPVVTLTSSPAYPPSCSNELTEAKLVPATQRSCVFQYCPERLCWQKDGT
ncbi:hypothetical protein OG21DRAFT_1521884 [Imleria badia]|nr:hypothetical protein OG21DRAFT_1521884 [Imleria badia]